MQRGVLKEGDPPLTLLPRSPSVFIPPAVQLRAERQLHTTRPTMDCRAGPGSSQYVIRACPDRLRYDAIERQQRIILMAAGEIERSGGALPYSRLLLGTQSTAQ